MEATTIDPKTTALASHLGCKTDEVGESSYTFEAEGGEYLVLTDTEADELTKESILDSVWAFNPSFLASHSEIADEEDFRMLAEKCENANKRMKRLINDLDHFVSDAILSDSRGHFLSHYDGEEEISEANGTTYFIYRTN